MLLFTKTHIASYWRVYIKIYALPEDGGVVRYRSKGDLSLELSSGYEAPYVNWGQGFLLTRLLNAYQRVWFSSKDPL